MGYLRMVGGSKGPPSKVPPANFSLGCEKFAFSEEFNGRGGEIRTPDPLLPKRNTDFSNFLTPLAWAKCLRGKAEETDSQEEIA